MFRGLLPVVSVRTGRVHYAIPPAARLLSIGGALALVGMGFLVPDGAGSAPRGLWWATALILVLAALSEDRWTFDREARRVGRRFGLLFPARTWSVDFDEVESLALVAGAPSDIGRRSARARDAGVAGGAPGPGASLGDRLEAEDLDQRERLAVSLQGLGRGPWVALVLRLSGDRLAVVAAARRRGGGRAGGPGAGPDRATAKLRADGERLRELAGIAFLDCVE